MFSMFFTSKPEVHNLDDVTASDVVRFNRFFHAMLARGVYLAPSAFEAGFVSAAHGAEQIAATLQAADEALAEVTAS
jgi:glutamate-1-semialdehyde 2,1-aminomutase